MCTSLVKNWEKLDSFFLIEFKSFRKKENITNINIPIEKLEIEMYSQHKRNKQFNKGIKSIFQICLRIPILWVFVPFLFISIITGLGDYIYKYIAKKRKIVPVGHCTENNCSIFSQKQNNTNKRGTN
ncbi:DCC1-like thiol-disulfide oxidoreductase family protein [Bacillus toyonensis]|uniref:DCC1-like thiol-disulfide oxidoreductase family protein n=1 Tax=Bacillus toyonensis TaxID=155322 RepID=UPI001C54EF3E|nr:DCC1-like thiol-disulfide oxidoreductase family protein [Bacillus toyonensis]